MQISEQVVVWSHESLLHIVLKAVVAWRLRNIYKAYDVGTECPITELQRSGSPPTADVCGRIGDMRIYVEIIKDLNYIDKTISKVSQIIRDLKNTKVILIVPYEILYDVIVMLLKNGIAISPQIEIWIADLLIIELIEKIKTTTPFSQYICT